MSGPVRRTAWSLATAACLLAALIAGPTSAAAPPRQAVTAEPALWVIRDADSTLYLFGSVHLLRPATVWETPRILAALEASTDIWFEVDATAGTTNLPLLLAEHGMTASEPLSRRLSPEDRRALSAAAGRAGLTVALLDGFQPWLAGMTVGSAPLIEAGYDQSFGVETRLRERAIAAARRSGVWRRWRTRSSIWPRCRRRPSSTCSAT